MWLDGVVPLTMKGISNDVEGLELLRRLNVSQPLRVAVLLEVLDRAGDHELLYGDLPLHDLAHLLAGYLDSLFRLLVQDLLEHLHQQLGLQVEGIGPLTATALVAALSDGKAFQNGRQFAAWLGLVPRQHSSGGKPRLFGISKRGDAYLRTLLIHGARSVVYRAAAKEDQRSRWIADKQRRLGTSKACVAVANKNARIVWALIARHESYRRAA